MSRARTLFLSCTPVALRIQSLVSRVRRLSACALHGPHLVTRMLAELLPFSVLLLMTMFWWFSEAPGYLQRSPCNLWAGACAGCLHAWSRRMPALLQQGRTSAFPGESKQSGWPRAPL